MKKIFSIFLVLISSIVIYGSIQSNANSSSRNSINKLPIRENKILVAYFSHSGNTKIIANHIHEQIGGDIFEIKTVNKYSPNYDTVLEQARKERSENYRPKLSDEVKNIKEYDIIYIGFPNWLGDMPMAVYSFLEQYDFSEKIVIPFTTHGSSGFSNNIETIQSILPNSVILEGVAVSRSSFKSSKSIVEDWFENLKFQNDKIGEK